MELRLARWEEIPRQRELWKLAFGDDDSYLDYVYQHIDLGEPVVLTEDGVIQSMMILYPMTLTLPEGKSITSAYVYALGTHPEARGRGYGRKLLAYGAEKGKQQGLDSLIVVPAQPSLHDFFASAGFQPCFTTQWHNLSRESLPEVGTGDWMRPIDVTEYQSLRKKQLEGSFSVTYSNEMMAYQEGLSRMLQGGLYHLNVAGDEGICVLERHSTDFVVTKELLILPRGLQGACALLAQEMPATTYQLRTKNQGNGQPFGMIMWHKSKPIGVNEGYFGLAYD